MSPGTKRWIYVSDKWKQISFIPKVFCLVDFEHVLSLHVERSLWSSAVQAFQFSRGYQRIQRGANRDVSPPFWDRAAVFYQCWPARLLVAPAQLHLGASLIPLLCHPRSVDVLHFHLENYSKGNALTVCKEEILWTCGIFFFGVEFKFCFSWDSNPHIPLRGYLKRTRRCVLA